ncbi:Na+/H+ antiporter [Catenulispora pinisilvae]|uniref:Na+/H+ antiporter n=1 Tax=Catenulispora pinisilvae TaxID=2705253 RepID=UPI0018926F12|nr:Na+/H+ antiporter [Catenulispora pinisilvae]
MLALTVIVVIGACVLVSGIVGNRFGIAPPVLMLAAGVLVGFVPRLRTVNLPPDTVLLVFLPALLYWESLNASVRAIWRSLRGVVLMSTLLVLFSAGMVAVVAHAFGVPWGPAWILGGALAPTDATAVAALGQVLPRRVMNLLAAESLINDGTALVVYGVAVSVTIGSEHFSTVHVTWLVARSYLGGAASGVAVAFVGGRLRARLQDPLLENVAILLIPFSAFLLAEAIGASGVLAVVACGLIMGQLGPKVGTPAVRLLSQGFWTIGTYVLNGALFVLIGLQSQSAVRNLTSFDLARALSAVAAVCGVLIAARFAFQFTVILGIRAVDRRPSQRARRVTHGFRVITGLAGFRGAVSLAAALAVPNTLDNGLPLPDRDVIVFVTAGVIAALMLQAFALPPVVRWANLPEDTVIESERRMANRTAAEEAMEALPDIAATLGTSQEIADLARREYEKRLRMNRAGDPDDDGEDLDDDAAERLRDFDDQYRELRLALLGAKRATLLRLRDERRIDDAVLRQIQAKLDIEEVRLARTQLVD